MRFVYSGIHLSTHTHIAKLQHEQSTTQQNCQLGFADQKLQTKHRGNMFGLFRRTIERSAEPAPGIAPRYQQVHRPGAMERVEGGGACGITKGIGVPKGCRTWRIGMPRTSTHLETQNQPLCDPWYIDPNTTCLGLASSTDIGFGYPPPGQIGRYASPMEHLG